MPTLDRQQYAPARGLHQGAYILADLGAGDPEMILMASGSEVSLIVAAGHKLNESGLNVRLVSFPSWELFSDQDQAYRDSVLPQDITARLSVEAGVAQGWHRWVGTGGDVLALDRFGASAPGSVVFEKLGFTVDNVVARAQALLKKVANA